LRYGEVVNQSERRSQKAADNPCGDHPERDGRERVRPRRRRREQVDDVEDDRRREQPERERDQHLVNRMTQSLCPTLHARASFQSSRRTRPSRPQEQSLKFFFPPSNFKDLSLT